MAKQEVSLKVAIIGGGPAGLAAAIELSRRPFIGWNLYEKKPEISEIGNGLSIQPNTWRMLNLMGAARHIKASDVFRPQDGHYVQHRDGQNGKLLVTNYALEDTPPHHEACRAHRARLQQALLREVNQEHIFVDHKLASIERLSSGRLRLSFANGRVDEVDLLIGADGIRSVVRQFAFPDHSISYTGATAYRAVVPTRKALDINGMPRAVIFWHGTEGKWVYTCPLGDKDFEVTCKIQEPLAEGKERASWGQEASVEHFRRSFGDFALPVKQVLDLVQKVQRFDFFAGSRLKTVIRHDSVALIGDASHPLSGAFGAGAGFALEDAHVLGGAIEWALTSRKTLGDALRLFDQVRTPHYSALYDVLDGYAKVEEQLSGLSLSPTEEIEHRTSGIWASKHNWMYHYKADSALKEAISALREGEPVGAPISEAEDTSVRSRL